DPSVTAALNFPASDGFSQVIEAVRRAVSSRCTVILWDAAQLKDKLLSIPPFGLRYYPELLPDGPKHRQAIATVRQNYDQEFMKLHSKLQFVGMSVYKEEASDSVDMDRIYIPLRVVPEGAAETDTQTASTNPLTLLTPGARNVILGDPGSGKSTLLRFL